MTRSSFEIQRSVTTLAPTKRAELLVEPGFGKIFTDHMAVATWSQAKGWHGCKIIARQPFQLDPAAGVLHYAQEIFEGLKAYRSHGGETLLFRPEQNARRFNTSATRLAMPHLPEELFLDAIEQLVRIDEAWIPEGSGSLYLRPFMFASEAFLGVRPANVYTFAVIASPAGDYFVGGKSALKLWVSEHLNRAGPGGTGAAKCGGNYAASLMAQAEATTEGCDQVIFLDAVEHRWIDELGGMNLFFVFEDGRVITPPVTGTILPGITRASIIELLRLLEVEVSEEPYAIDAWRDDATSGRLSEAFACGTAAVIAPIGEVKARSGDFLVGNGKAGPLTTMIKEQLEDIQRGKGDAPAGWVRHIG